MTRIAYQRVPFRNYTPVFGQNYLNLACGVILAAENDVNSFRTRISFLIFRLCGAGFYLNVPF